MNKYFTNLSHKANDVVNVSALELIIPEGFRKQLNSIEIRQLVDDELLQYRLQLHSITMDSCSRIVKANKGAKPLEKKPDISKRLREYLELINR